MTKETLERKVIIVGATSGIGLETAKVFLRNGYTVGVAGRRIERLESLFSEFPDRLHIKSIDINKEEGAERLYQLIEETGGMDIYVHVSGIGYKNRELIIDREISTAETNCVGFTRMVTAAYRYLAQKGGGKIAVVSSIAGVKGLGAAPAYSATKRFQNTYIDALSQLSRMNKDNILFSDFRPGFVNTELLKSDKFPMLMSPEYVAKKIYKGVIKGKRRVIIDLRYRIITAFWRLIPEWLWERITIVY